MRQHHKHIQSDWLMNPWFAHGCPIQDKHKHPWITSTLYINIPGYPTMAQPRQTETHQLLDDKAIRYISDLSTMHLAIPPPPVRNPEKGFGMRREKTQEKMIRAESVQSTSTNSSSEESSKMSFRRSILSGELYLGSFCYTGL